MTDSNPGPWVDPEVREARPWAHNAGIVKFIEFPVRIPAMSHRAFHLYWQRHHSPNVMNVTPFAQFMRKYNSTHRYPEAFPGLPEAFDQATPFEGAAEVWVNSIDEVPRWLGHPLYGELIQPDEPRFISQDGRVEILIVKEEVVFAPDPDLHENGLTKVHVLLEGRPGHSREHFHEAVSAHAKRIVADAGLRGYLQKLVVSHKLAEPLPLAELKMSPIDAVIELWFDGLERTGRFFADPTYRLLLEPELAQIARADRLRAVVAKVRVVHDEFSFQPSTMQPLPFNWRSPGATS